MRRKTLSGPRSDRPSAGHWDPSTLQLEIARDGFVVRVLRRRDARTLAFWVPLGVAQEARRNAWVDVRRIVGLQGESMPPEALVELVMHLMAKVSGRTHPGRQRLEDLEPTDHMGPRGAPRGDPHDLSELPTDRLMPPPEAFMAPPASVDSMPSLDVSWRAAPPTSGPPSPPMRLPALLLVGGALGFFALTGGLLLLLTL